MHGDMLFGSLAKGRSGNQAAGENVHERIDWIILNN